MNAAVVSIFVVFGIIGLVNTLLCGLYSVSKSASAKPAIQPSDRGNILIAVILLVAIIVAVVVLKTGLESITTVSGVLP
jgi:hypothetical protein